MPFESRGSESLENTGKFILPLVDEQQEGHSNAEPDDLLAKMEQSVSAISKARPHLSKEEGSTADTGHFKALLEVSAAVNSSLVTDDILQAVMKRAIELLKAERGFLMLLDEKRQLRIRTVYNLCKEQLMQEDSAFSTSIANKVAQNGESIYTSDAQEDERFSQQQSIAELNLRSIMCVPLKIKEDVIGVVYLDNSSEARLFLESDLYLFELFATQAAIAINNSRLYEKILRLKSYNEKIIASTPVGLLVLSRDGAIVTANAAAESIFKSRSIRGFTLRDLVGEKDWSRWKQTCDSVFSSGEAENLTRLYISVGNEEKVISAKISPLEDLDHDGRGLIVVVEDITEKTILENYVTISEKLIAKGEMAASVGHELNNFLAIISNNAELLQMRIQKQQYEKVEKSSQAILDNIDKIRRFTDNLMDLSKLDQEMVSYNLNHLIDDLLFTVKSQKRFNEVMFVVRMSPDLPDCKIDVGQIQQVILNLLYNAADALHASSAKKEIIIATRTDKSEQIITIRDSGCGILPENQEKIFEPHFSTKSDGHGLGLSNCRRIVENHFGTISVRSEPGKYTEFTVALPCGE